MIEQEKIIDLNSEMNMKFMKYFTFKLDDKVLKKGKLKLFTSKEFNLKFFLILDDNETVKTIDLPYPFKLERTKYGYKFDYMLESLAPLTNYKIIDFWENQSSNKSKFYNKVLTITIE